MRLSGTQQQRIDAVYARYSSHKQDDGTSIEVQLETCHRAADGPCVDYIDRARTGRAIGGRIQLIKLIEDAEAGRIGRVFVYKFDRLGRAAETHSMVAQLEECGVEVISATEGKEALSRGIQLVVAEHYSKALAERTFAGLVKRFEARQWTGGNPCYGYRVIDDLGKKRLAVDPNEAEVVRSLFESYLSEAVGVKELASRLREQGVPTRKGAEWCFTTVRGILTNSMLVGQVRFNRRRMKLNKDTGLRIPRMKDEAEHLSYSDALLRIISDDDFKAVQEKLIARARPGREARPFNQLRPFTGQLFCGHCGKVFYARRSKNCKGDYRYYSCGTRQRLGSEACECDVLVREDLLEKDLRQGFDFVFEDTESLIAEAVKEAQKQLDFNRGQVNRIQSDVKELDQSIARLTRLLTDSDVDPIAKRAISRQLGDTETKRESLQQAMTRAAQASNDDLDEFIHSVRQAIGEVKEALTDAISPAKLNRFVEDWIGPIRVDYDGSLHPLGLETAQAPDESGACVTSNIAGGGFEPPTSGL
jgi:site-specific DNA recombinase